MKNKPIIISISLIVVVIVGLFIFNAFLKKNIVDTEDQTQVENTVGEILPFVVVPEQAGGTNVFIENATLPLGGYVVIHKEEDGKPGVIIGISESLPSGTTENFLIDITEEAVEGDFLFAMLHTDDGNQEFSSEVDLPLTDNEGNVVLVRFAIVNEGALDNEVKL